MYKTPAHFDDMVEGAGTPTPSNVASRVRLALVDEGGGQFYLGETLDELSRVLRAPSANLTPGRIAYVWLTADDASSGRRER